MNIIFLIFLTSKSFANPTWIKGYDGQGKLQTCKIHPLSERESLKVKYKSGMKACAHDGNVVLYCTDGRQLCSKSPLK